MTRTLATYFLCLMKQSEKLTCLSYELQIESTIKMFLIFSFIYLHLNNTYFANKARLLKAFSRCHLHSKRSARGW